MAHVGFDWLCVDMQHGIVDYTDVVEMLRAISTTNTARARALGAGSELLVVSSARPAVGVDAEPISDCAAEQLVDGDAGPCLRGSGLWWRSRRRVRAEQVFSYDETLLFKTRRSLGFMRPVAEQGDARGEQAFGHAGMGGSLGYADPESNIGFGYVMNQMWAMSLTKPDPRAHYLTKAVYESLA